MGSVVRARDRTGERSLFFQDRVVVHEKGAGSVLDAGGQVVIPALVDAHVHLDKAHLLAASDLVSAGARGVEGAINAMRQVRRNVSSHVIAEGARRALHTLVRHGTVAARVHVEIDEDGALDLFHLHRTLQDEFAGIIELQLVAFPQHGITPRTLALMEAAVIEGVDVIGGCPYADEDQLAHLDAVFGLADRRGLPVDLHLDFDDDPQGSMVEAVTQRTRALGMGGQVTIGHVTKLAAMEPNEQRRCLDLLAEADVALVVMPATDLYLNGSGEPGTRSMAPIDRAAAAGVRVAVSNNNIHNAFSPYGNGSLLQAAWTAGLARQMGSVTDRSILLDAVTHGPASILGRKRHGTLPGERADIVVLDTKDPDNVVLQMPSVSATLLGGRLTYHRQALGLHDTAGARS